jgi:hypothetical protein
LPTLSHNLTLTGPGADSLTVERNSAGAFRIFTVGTGATVQISGLTITNGSENQGAGVLNDGALTVTDDVFRANMAIVSGPTGGSGGAVYNAGTLVVVDSLFANNTAASGAVSVAGGSGGAITNASGRMASFSGSTFTGNAVVGGSSPGSGGAVFNVGTLTISASTFSANSTSYGGGGGIANTGTLTVGDSLFSANTAGTANASGGGIDNTGRLVVMISNCTFAGNTAGIGGAINNSGIFGNLTVSGSTLSGNRAIYGAGVYNTTTLTVSNSTVAANLASSTIGAPGAGGGICNTGTLTLSNSTVAGNSATHASQSAGLGGGIYSASTSPVNLVSSTIAGNFAGNNGGGLYVISGATSTVRPRNVILAGNTSPMGADLFGRIASQGHNLIQDPSQGSGFDSTDLLTLDPLLDPNGLQDNGGPTQTIALLPGSPALNAGDPAQLGVADQRGVVRSGGVNIGAYQASATAFLVAAPDTVQAGVPFDVTVTAVDPFGQVAAGYTGTVTFSSADPYGATLPADYPFTPADGGTHTFPGGATLYTAGTWDVTASDTGNPGLSGVGYVAVTPAPAVQFVVTAPAQATSGSPFDLTVTAVDAYGNTDTNYQGTVTNGTVM